MSAVREHLTASAALMSRVARDEAFLAQVQTAATLVRKALVAGGTIYAAGNGGSAADAQHFVAELVGRFQVENRPPLPAHALTTDSSVLTALANDFGYEKVFSRQLTALIEARDVFIGISTSGASPSIHHALDEAHWRGAVSIFLTSDLWPVEDWHLCRVWQERCVIQVPSRETALIQQVHGAVLHAICAHVDEGFV